MKASSYQNPWLQGLILALAVVIAWFYYAQTTPAGYAIDPPRGVADAPFLSFKDVRFDFTLLTGDAFAGLKTYGEYPIQPSSGGRTDIFAPL